ncbi:CdaR family transcriptional regulator [Virgibacillus halodenitrificans]|uniref:CdaR family transcriptional regulator n=1 Tax=Virgibacillus halodenitrificans TaxID=1482 RepID=UPI001F333AFE|nr:sugar diacid recognition domain-containing protein [Virgibacillus halodenitrificans]
MGRVIELFGQVAQNIVKAVTEVSPFPISLTDEKGYIIGDSNSRRIGTFHPASKLVIEKNKTCLFTNEITAELENVLPGIATPLKFNSKTVGVLGIVGNPDNVKPYAELIKKYVEMRWHENYMEQMEELETKKVESFLQYLILNPNINKEMFLKYCKIISLQPNIARFCIIIDIGRDLMEIVMRPSHSLSIHNEKISLVENVQKIFERDKNTICGFLNTTRILLLQPSYSEGDFIYKMEKFPDQCMELKKIFKKKGISNITISSGTAVGTLEQSHISYKEAEDLLEMGKNLCINPAIYSYFDLEILLKLIPFQLDKDLHDKLMFRLKTLFSNTHFNDLYNNFITYCDNNLNVTKTAAKLYIHRNTLIYRLNKLEKLTSLDLGRFDHCMLLYLVLKGDFRKEQNE